MITREEYCRILATQEQEETILLDWFCESCADDMRCELYLFLELRFPTQVQAMASRLATMALRNLLLKEYERDQENEADEPNG